MAVAKKPTKAAPAKPKPVHPTNAALQARKEKTHRAQIERAVRRYKEDLRKWRKHVDEHPDLDRYSRIAGLKLNTIGSILHCIADQLAIIDDLRGLKPCDQRTLLMRAAALVATPR